MMMYLLNKKSILHCDEKEAVEHNQENISLITKLQKIKNYQCALVCKYQDIGNRDKEQVINECDLHNLEYIFECFDLKNGSDVYIGDDGFLVFYIYGQGYEYKGRCYLVEMAVKVLPFNDKKQFVDVSKYVLYDEKEEISKEQFNHDHP